jgi:hypothetical protein
MGDGWQQDFKQTHFDSYSPPDFYAKVLPEPLCFIIKMISRIRKEVPETLEINVQCIQVKNNNPTPTKARTEI